MSRKSQKVSSDGSPHHHYQQEEEELIPGLPNDIAHLILSKIQPSILYSVSHQWRAFIYSPLYPPYLCIYTILTPNNNNNNRYSSSSLLEYDECFTPLNLLAYDPISSEWKPLPPPPALSLLLRHPPFISRDLPVQSVTVGDRLVMVAGTTQHLVPALPRPLVFDPHVQGWEYGPPIPVPRRWCATGALSGSLYVVSGIGPHFSRETARAVERWDLSDREGDNYNYWEKRNPLCDGRFSREATDAVGWRGKLCIVNVKGDAAKQGAVYVAEKDTWSLMKDGMVSGWRGPVAAMDEDVVYTVDESKGVVKKYDEETDGWVNVVESQRLRGAQQMAARGGRLCVVCKGGGEILVVDVVASLPRIWVLEPPHGFNVAAVHILPRMTRSHSTFNPFNYSN